MNFNSIILVLVTFLVLSGIMIPSAQAADSLIVDFSATPISGIKPLSVQFSDAAIAADPANNTYLWVFGDGSTSTEINPPHTYVSSGIYTVNLTVTEITGNNATLTKPFYIHVTDTLNATDFSGIPQCGLSPLPVQFIDGTTLPHDQWQWNFGNGDTSNLSDPQYTYNGEGSWTVSLYISNNSGGPQSIISKTDYIRVIPQGVTSFSAAGTSDNTTLSLQFNDTSTGFVSPISWFWDFGDGTNSTEQNPSHTYADPSLSYLVSFTVSGYCGQTMTQLGYISASGGSLVLQPASVPLAPVADFSGAPLSGAAPLDVTFTDLSTYVPTSWSWSFGDGNTSTDRNPVHTYDTPGNYTVSLTAFNSRGSSAKTRTEYINVSGYLFAPPQGQVDFSGTPTFGTPPLTVWFTAFTTGFKEPSTYLWDFGDGTTSTVRNASHIYNAVGLYSVSLTVTGNDGYAETMVKNGYISTELPTIELILGQDLLNQSLPSSEPVPPTQSTPQAQSLPIAKSGLQTHSLPIMQSSVPDIPGYRDESRPQDVSTQNVLLAGDAIVKKKIEVLNWSLKSNIDNEYPDAFWMQVISTYPWKVDVYDADVAKQNTPGHMAEYSANAYVIPGNSLHNALRLQSSGSPIEIQLSSKGDGYQTIQTGVGGVPGQNRFYITLRQLIGPLDSRLPAGNSYHIVVTFEASNTNF